ncbi:MAG: hypothetical protein WC915_01545 [archaeon]|jgi:hypothetical protein
MGLAKTLQLLLLLLIGILFVLYLITIIFNFKLELNLLGIIPFLIGLILILQSIYTFQKELLEIPIYNGIGDTNIVNLKGHKKAKYFFVSLIAIIGIIITYIGIMII